MAETASGVSQALQSPLFTSYVANYITWLEMTKAKSPLTIRKERYALAGWGRFFHKTRVAQVSRSDVNAYVLQRVSSGISPRVANLDVLALANMLRYAHDEGVVTGNSATESWKPLKYVIPRRSLITSEQLQALVMEAINPKYPRGRAIADLILLCAYSGARLTAALNARWSDVDWKNKQLTLHTKFDKTVVVDMSEKLHQHLTAMRALRGPAIEVNHDFMFPSRYGTLGRLVNVNYALKAIATAVGLPNFHMHDCRHYFISQAIMAGIDTLTVAAWVGHSDGGVLIGKIYGHLNPQHRRAAAASLNFES